MIENTILLGLICTLVPLIAEYAQLRDYAVKGFSLYTVSGVIFILSGSMQVVNFFSRATALRSLLDTAFGLVGWFILLLGTVAIVYGLLME